MKYINTYVCVYSDNGLGIECFTMGGIGRYIHIDGIFGIYLFYINMKYPNIYIYTMMDNNIVCVLRVV